MVTTRKRPTIPKPKRKSKRQFVIDTDGSPIAVILPINEYEELLEDIFDLGLMAEREDEPTIAWDEVKRQLRANGLLPD